MGVASAAVLPHLARAHLVPGLRHVQHQAILVQRLKSKRHIGRNLGEKAGVGIAVAVENRLAG